MQRLLITFLLGITTLVSAQEVDHSNFNWPNGEKLAISLSYDDALNSQLDNAVPSLNRYNFKASFYVIPTLSDVLIDRMTEWRTLASLGHELGNHTIYHPCNAAVDREWVKPYKDIQKYSKERIIEEVKLANTLLHAIDGRNERTFTPPCGDFIINGENYLFDIVDQFVAIKGEGTVNGFSTLWGAYDVSGEELIDYVQKIEKEGKSKMINLLFHGIGGDHLSISKEAHDELLAFLDQNRDKYMVDSYINIMKYVKATREE